MTKEQQLDQTMNQLQVEFKQELKTLTDKFGIKPTGNPEVPFMVALSASGLLEIISKGTTEKIQNTDTDTVADLENAYGEVEVAGARKLMIATCQTLMAAWGLWVAGQPYNYPELFAKYSEALKGLDESDDAQYQTLVRETLAKANESTAAFVEKTGAGDYDKTLQELNESMQVFFAQTQGTEVYTVSLSAALVQVSTEVLVHSHYLMKEGIAPDFDTFCQQVAPMTAFLFSQLLEQVMDFCIKKDMVQKLGQAGADEFEAELATLSKRYSEKARFEVQNAGLDQ
ncbi:hypothetical protein FIfi106_00025 [Erwinia phage FIfi106]|nr:hypothetical protein FIfi106_00025 [Erwinia phage FIfi106]